MSDKPKRTARATIRGIEIPLDEADKSTDKWLAEFIAKRPMDPREYVLSRREKFLPAIEKGLDAARLQEYIQSELKLKRSATFCKKLLRELKEARPAEMKLQASVGDR